MNNDSGSTICSNIAAIIRRRETQKVLGDPADPVVYPDEILASCDALVETAISDAGWAPFHYDRNVDHLPEPWRAYLLTHRPVGKSPACFDQWFDDVKPNNKLPPMLAACGSVVLVNWIPQFRDQG